MLEAMKFGRGFVLLWVALVGCLALTSPVYGQLSLVSSTPAHGDTGVDTLLTMVLQFSAPLDTTARFEEPGDFFLGIEIFPADSSGEPQGDIILSPDSTTVTVQDLPLTPDTKFVVLLTGARSAAGEPLDRPYGFTFTTGDSLPEGSVSGTVSVPPGDPGGTAVGLFYQPPFGPGDDDDDDGGPDLEAGAIVPLSSDTFTVDFVPEGDYFVLGFKDVNQDGNFEFPGDAFGAYDADGDSLADKITLKEGDSLTDIDVAIEIPPAVTAREESPRALAIAQNKFPDAQLSLVSTDPISAEGESQSWMYGFYSAMEDTLFSVGHMGGVFFIFSFPQDSGDGAFLAGDVPLPENWIDSDMAADSAEAYGGGDFRAMYEDADASAFALTFIVTGIKGVVWQVREQGDLWPRSPLSEDWGLHFLNEIASEDTIAAWVFSYYSEEAGRDTSIALDVETGSPLEGPGPMPSTSARDNLNAANQAGVDWSGDAVLVTLGNVPDLTPDGLAQIWGFAYYSAVKDSILTVFMASGNVIGEAADSTHVVPSLEPLPPGWLDSPVVTPTAEAASGDFRNQHPDAMVITQLSHGLWGSDPFLAVWRFMYHSEADTTTLFIFVDALSGDIVTGIDDPEGSASIPRWFALEQNYPNPFNPETVIEYHLPQSGPVEMVIFNLLGQGVRVLVDEVKKSGSHQVRWDGTDGCGHRVTSGVYFYRLKAGEFIQTRKMLLLR